MKRIYTIWLYQPYGTYYGYEWAASAAEAISKACGSNTDDLLFATAD